MASCGQNCLVFSHTQQDQQQNQEFILPPLLVRTVNNLCITCRNNTSEYSHHFCYRCALPNTQEFLYHHTRCRNRPSPAGAAAEQQ
jgi:hypothetical protein